MIRNSYRYLVAGLIAVALVAGFTTSAGAAPAKAQDRAASASRAVDCSGQAANVGKAQKNQTKKKAKLAKAKKAVNKAKKALKKAKPAQKAKKAKALRQAKAKKKRALKRYRNAKRVVEIRQAQFAACASLNGGGSTGGGTGGGAGTLPGSPIQSLCDLGLPQQICNLAVLDPTLLAPLCTNGGGPLPQAICDLATGVIASLPGLPGIPATPGLPIPTIPGIPSFPGVPGLPTLPAGGNPVSLLCGILVPIIGQNQLCS